MSLASAGLQLKSGSEIADRGVPPQELSGNWGGLCANGFDLSISDKRTHERARYPGQISVRQEPHDFSRFSPRSPHAPQNGKFTLHEIRIMGDPFVTTSVVTLWDR